MSISLQRDGFSCCCLACNRLEVFFLPKKCQLMDPGKVAEGHLDILSSIEGHSASQIAAHGGEHTTPFVMCLRNNEGFRMLKMMKRGQIKTQMLRLQTNLTKLGMTQAAHLTPPAAQMMSQMLAPQMRTIYMTMKLHHKRQLRRTYPMFSVHHLPRSQHPHQTLCQNHKSRSLLQLGKG